MTAEELAKKIDTIIENQQHINERLNALETPLNDSPEDPSGDSPENTPDDKGGFGDWLSDLLGGGENNAE